MPSSSSDTLKESGAVRFDLASVQERSKDTDRCPTEEVETGRKKEGNANKVTFNTDGKPKKKLRPEDEPQLRMGMTTKKKCSETTNANW